MRKIDKIYTPIRRGVGWKGCLLSPTKLNLVRESVLLIQ